MQFSFVFPKNIVKESRHLKSETAMNTAQPFKTNT